MKPPDLPRLPMAGAVDADGHILEPPDLWERYLEPKYRDRAVRIKKDADGLEYLEIDNKPSKMSRKGFVSGLGVMDSIGGYEFKRDPSGSGYIDNASFGSMDPTERLARLDIENIERVFLYPTLGLLWEPECEDLELAMAYARAYNRWIVDFCSDSAGRMLPIAHIPFPYPSLPRWSYAVQRRTGASVSTPRRSSGAANRMATQTTTGSSPLRKIWLCHLVYTPRLSRIGRHRPASAV